MEAGWGSTHNGPMSSVHGEFHSDTPHLFFNLLWNVTDGFPPCRTLTFLLKLLKEKLIYLIKTKNLIQFSLVVHSGTPRKPRNFCLKSGRRFLENTKKVLF